VNQALLRTLVWPLALLLLAWLYFQSSQVDSSRHVRTVGHFEQLRQQDARLNQFVLQARFNLLRNYDPLVQTQRNIEQLLAALRQDKPEYFSAGDAPVQREFVRYSALFEAKFAMVEDFKSHNAVLRNSLLYFPLAVQTLLSRAPVSVQRNALLHDLLESVLLYDATTQSQDRAHIETVLQQLLQSYPQLTPDLTMLQRHVQIIMEYQHEVDRLTREVTQSESVDEADALFAAYGALYGQRQRLADRYRLALALTAVLILAYVAWTLAALQRARSTLTRSLRELEFQKFALDAHSIVSVADRSGRIIDINDKFTEISQYRRDELIGQDHRILNSGYHPHEFFKTMWATIGRGQVWRGLVRNRRKSGDFYWVDSTIVPFLGDDGKVQRYVSIRTDATDRVAADQQLDAQRAFYEKILETLGEGLYVQDAHGQCVYLNAEAEHLLGWRRVELLGKKLHPIIHHQRPDGGALAEADCPIFLAVRAHGHASMDDQVFVRRDGSAFPVALSSRAVLGEDGRIASVVVAFSDISSRKQVERETLRAREAAERAARAKSDFLANMSHEIRTPMNGIIGMSQLALETDLKPDQREYIGLVKSSADALLTIINDILDFSKIESGKLAMEVVEFSLESMLRDALKTLATRAHEKGLELLLHLATDVPQRVRGDPGRLRQVVLNLVGNAIKFTERGEVALTVQCEPGAPHDCQRLRFAVRDTGIGIPADKFAAIFESFTQADTSTTRQYGGTGLGLTISAQLVALMGGKIALSSTVGLGSEFFFSLDMPLGSRRPVAGYRRTGRVAGLPVLVVDDNDSNRRLLLDLLQHWQMKPVAVASAREALVEMDRAAQSGVPYALALLDVQMPEMDGFALAQRMKAGTSGVAPIMMITSQGQRGDAQRCRDLGLAAYLTKPVVASDLLDAIMTTLGEPGAVDLVTRHTLREDRSDPWPGQRVLHLLLAEDNAVNQRLASIVLSQQGHRLLIANNGQEAVALWQQQHFDAILMDVDMPVMNGYAATERIRALELARGGHTPIIAMTAHAMEGARADCLAHGMDGYVSKPIEMQALSSELERLLTQGDAPLSSGAVTAPSLAVADFAVLRQTIGDDRALYDELVSLYLRDAPVQLQRIRDAVASDDVDAVRRSAHTLRGMVGVFSAARTMAAAQQLEDQPDGPQRAQALQELEQSLAQLDQTLAGHAWP